MMTLQPDLNNSAQIAVVMLMMGADFDSYVEAHAHELVARYATSGCSKAAVLNEFWSGFTAVYRTIQLVREADWKSVALRTEKVYKHVFRRANFTALIHTNDPDHASLRSLCSDLLRKLNNGSLRKDGVDPLDRVLERVREHPKVLFTTENRDSYITTLAAYGECFENTNQSVSFAILAVLLQSEFLQIPTLEKYVLGTMSCEFDPMLGVISFVSIQNHNPGSVIRTFEEAIARVAEGAITREMIDRAIIQMIAKLDHPIAPSERGMFDFLFNVSSAVQQARKDAIFAITPQELINTATKLRSSAKRYAILGVTQDIIIPPGFEAIDLTGDSIGPPVF
jgi:Zn-dependent M16 (insulinase) family peptidase